MDGCDDPAALLQLLTEQFPALPLPATVLFVTAVILAVAEGALRFGFGGVPDGFIGMLALAAAGGGVLVWSSAWPDGCIGGVALLGWAAIGVAALLALVLLLFWRARRHDGATVLRDF